MIDYYENKGFSATVIVENKRNGEIDSHGTINLKVLAAYYKPRVEEEVQGSGAKWKLKHIHLDLVSYTKLKVYPYLLSSKLGNNKKKNPK